MLDSGPYRRPSSVIAKPEPTVEELFQLLDRLTGWGEGVTSVKVQYVPPEGHRTEGFRVYTTICFTPELRVDAQGETLPIALEALAHKAVAVIRRHGDLAKGKADAAELKLLEWKKTQETQS